MNTKLEIGAVYGVNESEMSNNMLILVDKDDKNCTFFNFTKDNIVKMSIENAQFMLDKKVVNQKYYDMTALYKLDKLPDDVFEVVKANMANKKEVEFSF